MRGRQGVGIQGREVMRHGRRKVSRVTWIILYRAQMCACPLASNTWTCHQTSEIATTCYLWDTLGTPLQPLQPE